MKEVKGKEREEKKKGSSPIFNSHFWLCHCWLVLRNIKALQVVRIERKKKKMKRKRIRSCL